MEYNFNASPVPPYGTPTPAAPAKPPVRGNLIKLIFDGRTRVNAIVALALVAACLVMMVAGFFTVKGTSVFEIPVLEKITGAEAAAASAESTQALSDAYAQYQSLVSQHSAVLQAELTPDEYQTVVEGSEILMDCTDRLSLNNIKKLTKLYEELRNIALVKGGSAASEALGSFDDATAGDVNELKTALDAIDKVLVIGMLIGVALCLLGGIFRLKGLVVLSLIVSILYNVLLVGTVMLVLSVVAHIALTVILSQLKKTEQESKLAY